MELKKGMLIGVSEYYKEVLGAWGVFVKRVKYDCKSVQHVWDQPMFLNPQILHEGKTIYNKTMWTSGFRRVRELVHEYVPGFMSAQAVVDEVREMGEEISFCAAEGMVKKIKAGMPREWAAMIESEAGMINKEEDIEMYVEEGEKTIRLAGLKTKTIHKFGKKRRPAAEKV